MPNLPPQELRGRTMEGMRVGRQLSAIHPPVLELPVLQEGVVPAPLPAHEGLAQPEPGEEGAEGQVANGVVEDAARILQCSRKGATYVSLGSDGG
jgi:hypothetical protein